MKEVYCKQSIMGIHYGSAMHNRQQTIVVDVSRASTKAILKLCPSPYSRPRLQDPFVHRASFVRTNKVMCGARVPKMRTIFKSTSAIKKLAKNESNGIVFRLIINDDCNNDLQCTIIIIVILYISIALSQLCLQHGISISILLATYPPSTFYPSAVQ